MSTGTIDLDYCTRSGGSGSVASMSNLQTLQILLVGMVAEALAKNTLQGGNSFESKT